MRRCGEEKGNAVVFVSSSAAPAPWLALGGGSRRRSVDGVREGMWRLQWYVHQNFIRPTSNQGNHAWQAAVKNAREKERSKSEGAP